MWYKIGEVACFCAGAIVPELRERGGHRGLLGYRLERAREAGCGQAVAVVKTGGESAQSLASSGFTLCWRDRAAFWPGEGSGS